METRRHDHARRRTVALPAWMAVAFGACVLMIVAGTGWLAWEAGADRGVPAASGAGEAAPASSDVSDADRAAYADELEPVVQELGSTSASASDAAGRFEAGEASYDEVFTSSARALEDVVGLREQAEDVDVPGGAGEAHESLVAGLDHLERAMLHHHDYALNHFDGAMARDAYASTLARNELLGIDEPLPEDQALLAQAERAFAISDRNFELYVTELEEAEESFAEAHEQLGAGEDELGTHELLDAFPRVTSEQLAGDPGAISRPV